MLNQTALVAVAVVQCDQIGRFIALWVLFKACGNNYLAQITHILGNFWKGVTFFKFLEKSFLGNFYRHLATFFWSRWLGDLPTYLPVKC